MFTRPSSLSVLEALAHSLLKTSKQFVNLLLTGAQTHDLSLLLTLDQTLSPSSVDSPL